VKRPATLIGLTVLALALGACGRNMADQPKYLPYQESILFEDRSSARPLLEGTVSRERGGLSPAFLRGTDERGAFLTEPPIDITVEVLQRGQERYNIYCAPCHNYDGGGGGMVVQKGFPAPASFHEPRLQQADIGYIYAAVTNAEGKFEIPDLPVGKNTFTIWHSTSGYVWRTLDVDVKPNGTSLTLKVKTQPAGERVKLVPVQ
jgi:hypothetical protein